MCTCASMELAIVHAERAAAASAAASAPASRRQRPSRSGDTSPAAAPQQEISERCCWVSGMSWATQVRWEAIKALPEKAESKARKCQAPPGRRQPRVVPNLKVLPRHRTNT